MIYLYGLPSTMVTNNKQWLHRPYVGHGITNFEIFLLHECHFVHYMFWTTLIPNLKPNLLHHVTIDDIQPAKLHDEHKLFEFSLYSVFVFH